MTSLASSTDTDRAEAFHELLSTLARALDVREIFQRLSAVAGRIVPHDEADLAFLTGDGTRFTLFASTGDGRPELVEPGKHCALRDPSVPCIFHDGFGRERGFATGVRVPVLVDGKPIGVLAFLSRQPAAYSERELALAQRIADYLAIGVSHQRLAEASRRAALERDRAANLEGSVELLRAIAGVLDIRTVFPRVSEIANKVLPHDRLTMAFNDRSGNITVQAASTDELPDFDRLKLADSAVRAMDDGSFIVQDLRTKVLPIVEPPDLQDRMIAAGFRSLLVVHTSARDQEMSLAFWS